MPKKTKKNIQELHGLTLAQVNYAEKKGVNIWNDDEMRNHCRGKQAQLNPDDRKEARATGQTLQEIEDEVRRADDMASVKIGHEKLKALKMASQVRQSERELIPAAEARESVVRCVSATRAELLKLAADLPPRLEGLTAAKMQKLIRQDMIATLDRLSSESSDIFAQ